MVYTKDVEVTNVSIATESSTGKSIYAVKFGEKIEVTPDLQKFIPQQANSKPPKSIYYDLAIIYFDFDTAVPYKVGSKWKLNIDNNGAVSFIPSK